MRILGRYITREFIGFFFACLLSLVLIAIIFATLAELDNLEKDDGLKLFLDAILSGIPLLIEIVTPVSVLLATVLTFISLSKSLEVVAMMAAGVGLWRIVFPILLVGGVISFLLYINQSYLAPRWGADKRTIISSSMPAKSTWQFYKGRLFFFSGLSPTRQEVDTGKIFDFDSRHRVRKIDTLEGLRLNEKTWKVKSQRRIRVFEESVFQKRTVKTESIREDRFPVVFKKEIPNPKYSDFSAILTEIKIKKMGAVNYEDDLFALYQKISDLLSIFVMILLALPFSLYSGRDSNVRSGIVLSVVMGFTFWLVNQIFISLKSTGLMINEVSAFGANVIFFSIAFSLIYLRRI
ncbi:MAG: YjgP/YjgQ family permease [Proteobacteria bacterium]|nr:YjgP/YjgQ family permease [Pseudomonadota bacterium]